LKRASGDYVVFIDNDIVVTPDWLERLIFHVEVDSQTGCVAACADRASHGQEVAYDGPHDFDSLAAFARARTRRESSEVPPRHDARVVLRAGAARS
jgi:GT2 family glycosyltransferase